MSSKQALRGHTTAVNHTAGQGAWGKAGGCLAALLSCTSVQQVSLSFWSLAWSAMRKSGSLIYMGPSSSRF